MPDREGVKAIVEDRRWLALNPALIVWPTQMVKPESEQFGNGHYLDIGGEV
jgi:hypothetical protein